MRKNIVKVSVFLIISLLHINFLTYFAYADNPGKGKFVSVFAYENRNMAVKDDGTVWEWGQTGYDSMKVTPVRIEGIDNVKKITPSLVLKNDGSLWKYNGSASSMEGIDGLRPIKDIIGSYIIEEDGRVWFYDGEEILYLDFLDNVVSIKGNMFLKGDGTLWIFDMSNREVVRIEGLNNIVDFETINSYYDSFFQYSIALKDDGTVWTWTGSYSPSTPTRVNGIDGVESIALGGTFDVSTRASGMQYPYPTYHCICLKEEGTVWSWGFNDWGQVGDGNNDYRESPVQVKGLDNILSVDAGVGHAIALRNDGTIWTWGSNIYGQLGVGASAWVKSPVKVANISGAASISVDYEYFTVLKDNGTVWELDISNTSKGSLDSNGLIQPVQVPKVANVNSIYGKSAVDKNGYVWMWDENGKAKRLDKPSGVASKVGDIILKKDGTVWGVDYDTSLKKIPDLNNVTAIDANTSPSYAAGSYYYIFSLKKDGTVWSTPYGLMDRISNRIEEYSEVIAIAAFANNVAVLKKDGTVWAYNKMIKGMDNVKSISAGYHHIMAVKNDGTVWISNGGNDAHKVDGMTNVISTSVGGKYFDIYDGTRESDYNEFFAALKSDGSVWIWGSNKNGLIDRFGMNMNVPVKVCDSDAVLQVGSTVMSYKGVECEIDPGRSTAPIIINGRTLLPIRGIIEKIDGTVGWDEAERKVTIEANSKTIHLWIDSNKALVDGEEKSMDTAPCIVNGRTMLPLRFIIENLGISVEWDNSYKRIYLDF